MDVESSESIFGMAVVKSKRSHTSFRKVKVETLWSFVTKRKRRRRASCASIAIDNGYAQYCETAKAVLQRERHFS